MAITKHGPNTIHLGGPIWEDNDTEDVASEVITPGHLVELFDDSGTGKWRKHGTATEVASMAVALNDSMNNKGIDDTYAIGDVVRVGWLNAGSTFFGLIPSGQNIQKGELLQSNGDGLLVVASLTTAAANLAKFQSVNADTGAVVVATRVRVRVIGS